MEVSASSTAGELLESVAARALARLPAPLVRLLAGRPIRIDGQQLAAEAQLAVRLVERSGGHDYTTLTPAEARLRTRRDSRVAAGRRLRMAHVGELELSGPGGPLPARIYDSGGLASPAPLVVYFHGGGHVVGDLDTHDPVCRYLAREIPSLVLAVDYRLGPEHPFPAAVDDALAAFRHGHAHAAALGADPARIAVAGDSAGANIAAAAAQLAVAAGGPAPAFQALIYPVTDYSKVRRSRELFAEGFFLTTKQMDWYREHYLSAPEQRLDPRASPLLGELAGLPPAHVVTAGFDPLRDEGEAYARALEAAGVEVTLRRETDLVHGFVNAVGLGGRAREATSAIAASIRSGLAQRLPSTSARSSG